MRGELSRLIWRARLALFLSPKLGLLQAWREAGEWDECRLARYKPSEVYWTIMNS